MHDQINILINMAYEKKPNCTLGEYDIKIDIPIET